VDESRKYSAVWSIYRAAGRYPHLQPIGAGADRRLLAGGEPPAGGQIYLLDNPLLREPLRAEHVKPRLIGHWGVGAENFVHAMRPGDIR
jgi:XFP-like protein